MSYGYRARFGANDKNLAMNLKPRPHHHIYIEILRRMSPEQRLKKAIELSELSKDLFRQGLRQRFPDLSEEEFHKLFLKRLELCHNRNY
ncbi:hypothetical protein DCC62_31705 [candidate division KSB1 bacterium]|nr:MAG: hypothetical protein DCC62_31705 [candidate division KSB1 bacterium]